MLCHAHGQEILTVSSSKWAKQRESGMGKQRALAAVGYSEDRLQVSCLNVKRITTDVLLVVVAVGVLVRAL
eukprot:2629247-Amphidinium_carterae.1